MFVILLKDKTKSEENSQQAFNETGDLLKKLDSLKVLTGDETSKINLSDPQCTLHK